MDTLWNDLLSLLFKHFDVSPTVFLTNKQLELEDVSESMYGLLVSDHKSVYEQENWPWILTNLKFLFIPTKACARDGDKHRIFEFINEIVDLPGPRGLHINYLLTYAYLYNQKGIITKYPQQYNSSFSINLAISYAVEGGHFDLFLDHVGDNDFVRDYLTTSAFLNGKQEVIDTLKLDQDDCQDWILNALIGTTTSNNLNLLQSIVNKYREFILEHNLFNELIFIFEPFGPETYETVVWIFENNFVSIDEPSVLLKLLNNMAVFNCQPRLIKWIIEYFNYSIDEVGKHSLIVNMLENNRLDCALCLMDEASVFRILSDGNRKRLKSMAVINGYRKLYNKLIQN